MQHDIVGLSAGNWIKKHATSPGSPKPLSASMNDVNVR